jgi:hypothetical protein
VRCSNRNFSTGRKLTTALKRLTAHGMLAIPFAGVCAIHGMIAVEVVLRLVGRGPLRVFGTWYGPLVWWPGLLLGFFVNRRALHRAACFVWLPGLIWLAFGIASAATSWRPAGMSWMTHVGVELFPLQPGECGTTECLRVLFCTWPAVNSVAYSIGAALAFLFQRNDEGLTGDYTTLGLK